MTRTPSMDDKNTPSPPNLTVEEYTANKAKGINPGGQAFSAERPISQPSKSKKEKPTPIQDEVSLRDLRNATKKAVDRFRRDWEGKHAELLWGIAEAAANKTSLPSDYWKEEHEAHSLYKRAMELQETLK